MSDEPRDIIIERLERRLMNKENELGDFSRNVSDLESRIINLEQKVTKIYELFSEYIKKTQKTIISEEWPKTQIVTEFKGDIIIAEDDYFDPFISKYEDRGPIIVAKEHNRASSYSERICRENEDIIITAR